MTSLPPLVAALVLGDATALLRLAFLAAAARLLFDHLERLQREGDE